MIIFLWQPANLVSGAGSHFLKAPWYIGISDCGWKPDNLNLLSEPNLEKYRLQRRLIGPVYTPDSVKDLEEPLDAILTKNVNLMKARASQSVDMDLFFNKFLAGKYLLFRIL